MAEKHATRNKILRLIHEHGRCFTSSIMDSLGQDYTFGETIDVLDTLCRIGLLAKEDDITCVNEIYTWALPAIALHVQVINYLNTKIGTSFRRWKPNGFIPSISAEFVLARLAEGVTVQQMLDVIDMKVKEWLGTPQAIYLRPQTLFNQTKCETYIAQLSMPKPSSGAADWAESKRQ